MELLGQIVQNLIKPTQVKQEFLFQFCNVMVMFSVCVVWPSVLSLNILKLLKTKTVKNICIQEKFILELTFNPGLALTSFQTTIYVQQV